MADVQRAAFERAEADARYATQAGMRELIDFVMEFPGWSNDLRGLGRRPAITTQPSEARECHLLILCATYAMYTQVSPKLRVPLEKPNKIGGTRGESLLTSHFI